MRSGVEKITPARTRRPRLSPRTSARAARPTRRAARPATRTARPTRRAADATAEDVAAEPRAEARHPWFAFLVAAGVALGLLVPCAAWADEADGSGDGDAAALAAELVEAVTGGDASDPVGLIEAPAAQVADEALAEGLAAGEEAVDAVAPAAALDDNGLRAEAVQREAEAAAAAAAQARPATAGGTAATGGAGQAARTVNVAGTVVGYADAYRASTAPASGAGLWMGSDSTTDGSWAYFIGHNPGPFHCVMGLGQGAAVTVCDGSGNARTYHVVDVFTVPDTTYWEEIQGRVTSHGESVILQTCVGDNASYRIVVAA